MILEEDIVTYLKTVEAISYINGQIYGVYRPQGERPLPELLITRTLTARQDTFCGVSNLANADMQIDVYGSGVSEAAALAQALRLALKNFSGVMGDTPVEKVFLSNEFTSFDSDPGTVRVIQLYNFWYLEE